MSGWMALDQWNALVRGEGCPLCAYISGKDETWEHGYTIVDLSFSRLFLNFNQYVPGYCVLVCNKHVREPFELAQEERHMFFDDLSRAGKALEEVFGCLKMNFQILGNTVPHLHVHLVPRYHGDPTPGRPIDPCKEKVELTQGEYRFRVTIIRKGLGIATT